MTPSDRTLLTDPELDDLLAALAGPVEHHDDDLTALRARTLDAVEPIAPTPVAVPADVVVLPQPAARPRGRRRFAAALVAAAVLALVGVLTAVLVQAQRPPAGVGPAGSGAGVTCLVDPDSPTGDADTRALALIRARLAQVSTTPADLTSGPGRIAFSVRGVSRETLMNVCTSPRPSLRPLVIAPVPRTGASPTGTADDVTLPTSDTAFAALPATDQARVRAAVAGADCAGDLGDTPADRSVIVCDSTTAPTAAYLLGPAVVDSDQISAATAVEPNPQTAAQGWTAEVSTTPDGSRALAAYTRAHVGDASEPATACAVTATPCATHLGIVVSDAVIATPVVLSAIDGPLQISGSYDEVGITAIAAGLDAGDLTLVAT